MKKIIFGILISLFVMLNYGYAQQFGDWGTSYSKDGDFVFAATMNDSDALLGQYCYFKEDACLWMLGTRTRCAENHKYPVLANSESGSFPLEIYCTGKVSNGSYLYAFTDCESISDMVSKGSMVGFAIPLLSDQFKVVRFSLRGANSAINKMSSSFKTRLPTKIGTRDKIL